MPETASVVFVADDLGAWLVGLLADAGRKKLTALVLGRDQERALRKAAADAVQDTATEMDLSAEQARRLAMVIRQAFRKPVQDAPLAGSVTMLEVLRAGVARRLALDDAERTGTGQSAAGVLEVPCAVLAETLTGHLVREIMLRGSGGGPLTPLADQLNHDRTHLQLARLVASGLTASAASTDTGSLDREDGQARLAGMVRVSEADPRRLGVHAAISVPGVQDEIPPEYVPRDVDAAEFGLWAKVGAAAQRGGFVLLVGGSSVGKTRSAAEAVKALLPDWWLVHPAGPDGITALAQALPPRTVVWLDELQRYLDGEHGLTGGIVRALLTATHPALLIGTLWPDWYNAYTVVPASGAADPHAREREVLDLAAVIHIDPGFSPEEHDRARAAATRDRRLAVALEAAGYGLTQTLAAAPQLVARWQNAKTADPYAWAVMTAALDAARLGAHAPLSPGLLRAAAQGYCTSQQQAEAPDDWFDQALAYVTGKLHGAVAALNPAGTGAGMGQIAGYTAADYLVQHASRERRHVRVPASTWDALVSHIRDPTDAARLADSASSRLLYRYAIPLYRHAADAGDRKAVRELFGLLYRRGDLEGAVQVLHAAADAGDDDAGGQLARLLADRGDLDELRARADSGDHDAAMELAGRLADRGDLDELRARADSGDHDAATRLTEVLAECGDLDGLRARADSGDHDAARRLAGLLDQRGDLEGAEQVLRAAAGVGDHHAARRLAWLLAKRGDLDGVSQILQVLRAAADAGDHNAAMELAWLLAERGDLDELRTRADAGDRMAAIRLAELLERRGDLDGLRTRADAGDHYAARRLPGLLEWRGDLDELRTRADAGDRMAARPLARLLAERGDLGELRTRADAGDRMSAKRLAELLERRGDLDRLRTRADAGDYYAARLLPGLLIKRGDLDGLRTRADAGDHYAAGRLARLLAGRGDLEGLRARADAGDHDATMELARLLDRRGDLEGAEQVLRAAASAGDHHAARRLDGVPDWLPDLMVRQGRSEDAARLRQFGLNPDGSIASA